MEGEKVGCLRGEFNITYYNEAKNHANYMATVERQSHYGFKQRNKRLGGCVEICCESWPNQSLAKAAKDAFTVSWPTSPDHWRVAVTPCKYFGCAMAKGRNGITYTCIIVSY